MGKIGIFWIYKQSILGKAIEISKGQNPGIGLVDSPDCHSELWENNECFQPPFPELKAMEYQTIPRGRVVYHQAKNSFIIYLDKTLMNGTSKQLINHFFNLQNQHRLWRTDLQYTTQEECLNGLFDDDF